MSGNTLSVFDWAVYTGRKPHIWHGSKVAYASGDGQVVESRSVRYNARKERLHVRGRNLAGRCVMGDGVIVYLTPKGTRGEFRGALSRADFRRLLVGLKKMEICHRDAQLDGLDRQQ